MLHWSYKYLDAIVTDRVVSSVWSVTIMSPAKMTEPIEIHCIWTRVDTRNHY